MIQYYVYYYYIIVCVVSILGFLVSNRILLDFAIIIGNVMDIYVFGWICIVVIGYMYVCIVGCVCVSYMWYYRVLGVGGFLFLLCLIELSAHIFQSLTLSNRISINIVAGCLFSYLIALLSSFHVVWFWVYLGICSFEFMNIIFQYGIFLFLIISLVVF